MTTEVNAHGEDRSTGGRLPYSPPELHQLDISETLGGDPSFPQEGFFTSTGLPEDNEPVGPGSV
jgi:hypothetical protein